MYPLYFPLIKKKKEKKMDTGEYYVFATFPTSVSTGFFFIMKRITLFINHVAGFVHVI